MTSSYDIIDVVDYVSDDAVGTEGVALGGLSADDVSDDAFDDVWASGGNELECLFGGDGPVAVAVPLYSPSSSTSLAACHNT